MNQFDVERTRKASPAMSLEFLLTSLVVVLSPGTGVLYTLAVGLSRGQIASIAAAFGCTLGIVPHLTASILGLAALLHTSTMAFQVLKIVGLLYLLYLAYEVLRQKGALAIDERLYPANWCSIVVKGILINILNPKLSLFFLAFLPQFVPAERGEATLTLFGLSAVFMLMTFVVFVVYGLFAAAMRAHIISRPNVMTWLRRSFAGAFVLLGLKLAMSER
jgi:threonine/homoserine/homoserine lactone efflux protein